MNPDLRTGHPEIDSQHQTLFRLNGQLGEACTEGRSPAGNCDCMAPAKSGCVNRLAHLLGELLTFMTEHFCYEQRLMRLLPASPECRQHVSAHQLAHAEISQHLSELARDLDRLPPLQSANRLQTIMALWMGQHDAGLDRDLVQTLKRSFDSEVAFDVELARLLGAAR